MRSSNSVVFCAIDDLIPASGKPLTGFPEFLDSLTEAGISCVWLTSRSRHQLDSTLRKLGHAGPFIAEGGSCVYLPEGYFHLKPTRTIRLGRFTCIPVATPLPAAAEALDLLAEQTGITVVPLRSLTSRELIQNTGLSHGNAESIRQRDFDELFFFAGASNADVKSFRHRATEMKFSVRPHGSLWSLAVNPSVGMCVRELRKLYERALHSRAFAVAVATASEAPVLFPTCDRSVLLSDRETPAELPARTGGATPKCLLLFHEDTWLLAAEAIQARHI